MTRLNIEPNHALCRAWGHAWIPHDVNKVGTRFLVRLQCVRCETIRSQLMTRLGVYARGNRYQYGQGYIQKGQALHTREGREQVRALVLRHLVKEYGSGRRADA